MLLQSKALSLFFQKHEHTGLVMKLLWLPQAAAQLVDPCAWCHYIILHKLVQGSGTAVATALAMAQIQGRKPVNAEHIDRIVSINSQCACLRVRIMTLLSAC